MFMKIACLEVSLVVLKVHAIQKKKKMWFGLRNVSTQGSTENSWLNEVWKMVIGSGQFLWVCIYLEE